MAAEEFPRRRRNGARPSRGERGQMLILFAGLIPVIVFVVGAIVADIAFLQSERLRAQTAADLAALAAASELPTGDEEAIATAREYARLNGYDDADPGVEVDVTPRFNGDLNLLEVTIDSKSDGLFMGIFGVLAPNHGARAVAGFLARNADVYLAIDATGSMHSGCNAQESNGGGDCPIKEARDGATGFVDTLLSARGASGTTAVGVGAFRGCYDPPRDHDSCVRASGPGSMIRNLTSDTAALRTGIAAIRAIGADGQPPSGSGTNICQALKKAQSVLAGPGGHTSAETRRFVVILSDGDNTYNASVSNQDSPQSPEVPCRPSNASTSDGYLGPNCRSDTQSQEGKVDGLTYDLAETLKSQDIEVYVIAFGVCGGTESSGLCDAGEIGHTGGAHPDSEADRNLLKCIASSAAGTNDHYFESPTAEDLPEVFGEVARALTLRLVE